jgi:hypothetical protein
MFVIPEFAPKHFLRAITSADDTFTTIKRPAHHGAVLPTDMYISRSTGARAASQRILTSLRGGYKKQGKHKLRVADLLDAQYPANIAPALPYMDMHAVGKGARQRLRQILDMVISDGVEVVQESEDKVLLMDDHVRLDGSKTSKSKQKAALHVRVQLKREQVGAR